MTINIDTELERLVEDLEQATDDYAKHVADEAAAEASYKALFHQRKLMAIENGDSATKAESVAFVAVAREGNLSEWHRVKAQVAATKALMELMRVKIDAVRTLAANQRSV